MGSLFDSGASRASRFRRERDFGSGVTLLHGRLGRWIDGVSTSFRGNFDSGFGLYPWASQQSCKNFEKKL